jgi:hypothetical protein
LSTYEHLLQCLDDGVSLVFIQTPPDAAYEMYRSREVQDKLTFTYRDFLRIYDAPVEADIPSLGRRAQVIVHNAFGMSAFRRILDQVADHVRL